MQTIYVLSVVVSLALVLWGSSVALAKVPGTNLAMVLENPAQFNGEKVKITAPIAENSALSGNPFERWSFMLNSCDKGMLRVERSGFNPGTIQKGWLLVEKARLAGDKVTVTGTIKEGPSGLRMVLDTVEYAGATVNLRRGPFVEDYYGDEVYPGSPEEYAGHLYWHGHFPIAAYAEHPTTQVARVPSGCETAR